MPLPGSLVFLALFLPSFPSIPVFHAQMKDFKQQTQSFQSTI